MSSHCAEVSNTSQQNILFLCESKYGEKIFFPIQLIFIIIIYSSRMSIKLYEHWQYEGREVSLTDSNTNLVNIGFNDKVSSVKVDCGTWILWEHIHFEGKYYIIGLGHYDVEHL